MHHDLGHLRVAPQGAPVTRARSTSDVRRGVAELGLAGLALLAGALLLMPRGAGGGAEGTARTVLGCFAILVVPGWLVGRLADEEGDAIGRLVGGTVATLTVCALSGFVAFEHGLRVSAEVFAVPLLVLVAVTAVLGVARPAAPRAPVAPLLAALGLGAAALLGALGTHLALPKVPVEPAFSIEAAHAVASPTGVVVTVTVTRVHTVEPTQLQLFVGYRLEKTTLVHSDKTTVRLTTPRGWHAPASCPTLVWIEAPNKAFLKPPISCVGF
jgi:hypothetical protein